LDDGVVDTLALVGATAALTLPLPSAPRTTREFHDAARQRRPEAE
jgi:hypothetical protein